ncbi:MAG TPA: phytoene/squalene synthase family protein [Polyangiaceae bacterium]|nr:phytoene/squalene synthase family protein [Polyangiaceae bacterium]
MNSATLALPHDTSADCAEALRQGSKSFALAGRLLPPQIARDAATLYTFCRRVDDTVDLAAPGSEQRALDAVWLRVRSVFRGESQSDPFWASFAELVRRVNLPERYVIELLLGMQMDVDGTRYETVDQLLLYCHRVAGVVGLMMCHVLGVRTDAALRNAAHLGIALQLTNISRDVQEDWERGRMYVPAELLRKAGLPQLEPEPRALTRTESNALSLALAELAKLAERFYRSGDDGLPALSARARFAVRTARLVYSHIGVLLQRRDYDVLAGRVIVPAYRKLVLLLRAALVALVEWLLPRRRAAVRLPERVLRFPEDVLPAP